MMAWMRRSGEMLVKPPRMALMAPVCLRVLSIRMAPNTIQSTVTVITSPCRVEAKTRVGLICQPHRAMNTVNKKGDGHGALGGPVEADQQHGGHQDGEKATRASRVSVIIASCPSGAEAHLVVVLLSGRPYPVPFSRYME